MTTTAQLNPAQPLVTLDEFSANDAHLHVELVAGQVVALPGTGARHGKVYAQTIFHLGRFIEPRDLGHVLSNNTLVVTQRNPDTCRGMDVCFISYEKLPKGPLGHEILTLPPDLIFEVRAPSDLWTDMITKALEYLAAGVTAVVLLDPKTESASVFRSDTRQEIFEANQLLVVPDVLPGFEVLVKKFFE